MSDHKEVTYKQSTEGGKPCKPAVVFVHSSWHTPKHFEPTCQLFNANGFATECPLLPSCSGNLTLSKPLLDDAKIIYDAVSKLVVQGLEVIVVMHGYGGLVGSEAITKDLSKKERQAKNLQGGIIHLLYISAHVGPVGHTVAGGISGGGLPNRISRHVSTCVLLSARRLTKCEHRKTDLAPLECGKCTCIKICPIGPRSIKLCSRPWCTTPLDITR